MNCCAVSILSIDHSVFNETPVVSVIGICNCMQLSCVSVQQIYFVHSSVRCDSHCNMHVAHS